MEPGRDCLRCHGGGEATRWTVAGTVYPAADSAAGAGILGATVRVRDATGWSFGLRTNAAGNFYSAEKVAFPIQVCVDYRGASSCMSDGVASGGCNSCHAAPGAGGEAGRITVP
jgi:hypothetical protein